MYNNKLNIIPSINLFQNSFIIYVRTLQYWNHLKEGNEEKEFINIPFKTIQDKFKLNIIDIDLLSEKQFIERREQISSKGIKYFQFRTLLKGPISMDLLTPDLNNQTSIHKTMKEYLKAVSMPLNANCTEYFKLFLKNKHINIDLFFSVDYFGKRVHTPVTILDLKYRDEILLKGDKTASIDVGTMQPLLLAEILKKNIGANKFTDLVYNEDIYIYLQNKANLKTRADAKKYFYKIAFGKPDNKLIEYFGNENWVNWVNDLKSKPLECNPKKDKLHNNLAFLLQSKEVEIMTEIWQKLANNGIYFLSVHDEVLVRDKDLLKAKVIFEGILNKYFTKYKLNINHTSICIDNEAKVSQFKPINDFEDIEPTEKESLKTSFKIDCSLWIENIVLLIDYFEKVDFPKGPINLTPSITINDIQKFLECHFFTLYANEGNQLFFPYWQRLYLFKDHCEHLRTIANV
jgi:hypothetical protein